MRYSTFSRVGRHAGLAICTGAFALCSSLAYALVLEEVIVTTQKKEEPAQDVSVSVSAFTGDAIEALGFSDTTEITQQVPNLQLNAWSPNVTIFNLRGVSQNNFTDNLEAPVAVYFDDLYMSSINGISGQLFDVERVEVARGPQGTLFGRNATGGLIHYISRGADEDGVDEGYAEIEVGDFSRFVFTAAAGMRLSDTVRARGALRWKQADGYVESRDAVPPLPGSGQDIGGEDGWAARLNVQADISDRLSGDFWVKLSQDNEVPTGGYVFENCDFVGADCPVDAFGRTVTTGGVVNGITETAADVHEHYGEQEGFLDRDTTVLQAKFDYQINDRIDLVSITGHMALDKSYLEDGDALPLVIVNFQTDLDYTQASQEFRFSGDHGKVRWLSGIYFLDISSEGDVITTGAPGYGNINAAGRLEAAGGAPDVDGLAAPGNAFLGAMAVQKVLLDSRNWSVFGQLEYDFSDALSLTAGLRWSQDDKDIDWSLTYTDSSNTTAVTIDTSQGLAAQVADADVIDYGDYAMRVALDWKVNPDTLVFASYNRGIKGGNWAVSAGSNLTAERFQHDEEVLNSIELGVKADLSDTLRLNATWYNYDYQDYQAFSLLGGAPFVANTDAKATGAELELFWNPTESLDVILGVALSDSEVDEVFGTTAILADANNATNQNVITNAELPNAPDLSLNYLVRYYWALGSGELSLQLDGVHYGDQFLEVTNGPGTLQESYNVNNLRVSWQTEGGLSVTAWGKNITDEEYKVYSLDLGALGTTTFYAPPQTFGASVRYRF